MNKRQICLLIAALGTLGVMLALSAVTTRPAIAQTPTPTSGLFSVNFTCTPTEWTSPGEVNIVCVPSDEDLDVITGTGGINISGGNWQFRYHGQGSLGCYFRNTPFLTKRDYYSDTNTYGEWTEYPVGVDPCTGEGNDDWDWHAGTLGPWNEGGNLGTYCPNIQWVMSDFTMGWNVGDPYVMDGETPEGLTVQAYLCSPPTPPPPVPECGTGEITDTHFISNSWTVSGASWSYSFYAINPGGTVSKIGRFVDQYGEGSYGGEYIVSVIARSAISGMLNISAGGAATPITVTGSSSFHEYSGTLTMVGDGSGYTPVVIANASGSMITVDRICLDRMGVLLCGLINDYHFASPFTWAGGGGAEWSDSIWHMDYGGYIAQSIAITGSGTYSVIAQIRQESEGPTTELGIVINGNEVGSLSYSSTSWAMVTTTLTLDSLYGELKLTPTGGTLLDWFCIVPGNVTVTGYPCAITAADIANSGLYISNSKMEIGNHIAIPGGFVGIAPLPLSFSIGDFSAYFLSNWQAFEMSTWFISLITGDVDGVYRVREGGPALGLIPKAFGSTKQYLATNISGDYNVVLRMKPKYHNAHLYVNGIAAPDGTYQTWEDAAVYVSGNSVALTADCGGLLNGCTPQNGTIDVVEVDDVYVVPGPALTCGTTTPMTTPIGSCINPNPDFILGGQDWQLSNGAYIDNVYGWAVLPGGSLIQQQVPTGGAWEQSSQGINLGYSYVIAVGAHLEHSNAPGQYTVMVGASQPGQLSFNHELVDVTSVESTDMFTVTSDMLNGTSLDIRIANEAGGTVMLDYVCIRYNGGPGTIPPNGQCLGTWYTSDGTTPAINPGPIIPPNNYVKNAQAAMGGGYSLDLAGLKAEHDSTFTLDYCNATSGICDSIGAIPLSEPEFASSFSFVVPSGGYYGGELRLNNDDGVTYDNLCLRQSQNGPVNPNPPSPPPLPFPECGSVNNTASFYMMGPYSVTGEFTGTEYTAAYLSEMIYNYSIYPLVCTTISIANWQYNAAAAFWKMFEIEFGLIFIGLNRIIALLEQILDAIKMPGYPPLCGILDIILWIIKALLEVLFKILLMIFQTLGLIVKIFSGMANEARGENAIMYPFNCSGDGQWTCFVLAGIAELDWKLGDWLNIISLIVVAMLTVSLAFWVTNQVRDMMQPGSGGDTSG